MGAPSFLLSILFFVGFILVYTGERVAEVGVPRGVLSGLGALLVVVAVGWRALRLGKATGDRRKVEQLLVVLAGVGGTALLLYFLQSDAFTRAGMKPLSQEMPKLGGVLEALWPALLCVSLLATLLGEMSFASMARAPAIELGRVRDAIFSGVGLGCAVIFSFAALYVVTERDTKWDLSHFRAAKPGEATLRLVQSLDDKVSVALFFPPANDVAEQVKSYFETLAKDAPKLSVEQFDQALDVAKAKELSVTGNGSVVIYRGERKEQLMLGTELDKSRTQLRNLDQEIQKRLLAVAKSKKTIYLTAGHGERRENSAMVGDQRGNIRLLKNALRAQNYELRDLGAGEGLGSEVPKDAAAVMVLGPQSAFQPAELETLKSYFKGGGRLFIALDPEEKAVDLSRLLVDMGVSFTPVPLANDVAYARVRHQPSDKGFILTGAFSSHPSITSNGRLGDPVLLQGSGALEELKDKPQDVSIDVTMRSHPGTWNDLDGNFEFNAPSELRKSWSLAMAVTKRPGAPKAGPPGQPPAEESRAIVAADSDFLTDDFLAQVKGNGLLVVDGLKWLFGDEALAGATNTEEDAPIQKTRKQDAVWFYGTVFVAPALVLGLGFWASRRRRKKAEASKGDAPKGNTTSQGKAAA